MKGRGGRGTERGDEEGGGEEEGRERQRKGGVKERRVRGRRQYRVCVREGERGRVLLGDGVTGIGIRGRRGYEDGMLALE